MPFARSGFLALVVVGLGSIVACQKIRQAVNVVSEEIGVPDVPAYQALLVDNSLTSQRADPVLLGRVWLDKPHPGFFPAEAVTVFRKDLKAAATNAPGALYSFVKCERRGVLPETTDRSQCVYLLDQNEGVEFEFVFLASDGVKQCATLLEPGCAVHQAIRAKGWNNGVQRPALFVERNALGEDDLAVLLFRPHVDELQVGMGLVKGGGFPKTLSDILRKGIGIEEDKSFANLIHLSNYWAEQNYESDLAKIRLQAFLIVSIGLFFGQGISAVSVLQAGETATTLAKVMAVIDLAAAGSGAVSSTLNLFGGREQLREMRPGPARDVVQAAIVVADAAPWLDTISAKRHLVATGFRTLMRWNAMRAAAKRKKVPVEALSRTMVDALVAQMENRVEFISEKARAGDTRGAAEAMEALAEQVASALPSGN